jgi:cytochrome b561
MVMHCILMLLMITLIITGYLSLESTLADPLNIMPYSSAKHLRMSSFPL